MQGKPSRDERRRTAAREWNRRNPDKVKAAKEKRMQCPKYKAEYMEYQRAYYHEVRKIRIRDKREKKDV